MILDDFYSDEEYLEYILGYLGDEAEYVFESLKSYATTARYDVLVEKDGRKFLPTNDELEFMLDMDIKEIEKALNSLDDKDLINLRTMEIRGGDRFGIVMNPKYAFNGNKPSIGLCKLFGISNLSNFYMEYCCEQPILKKQKKEIMNAINRKHLLEKDIEKYLINNLDLIESGMVLIKSQYKLAGGIIDLLVKDKNNKTCIIEIKKVDYDKSLVFQSVYYPTEFDEEVRMITITPGYTDRIKKSLESLKYVELKQYYYDEEENLLVRDFL